MSAKHTLGPWELRDEFGMQGLIYPHGSENPVAAVTGYYARSGATLANANLIAAAPELLQMVIDLLDALGEGDSEIENDARALIAKATGSAA